MSSPRLRAFLRHLQGAVGRPDEQAVPDARLVERFVAERDEAAFELLICRHGSLVLGVCERILRQEQDAEDAFQATFLILARRAGSLGRRDAVAGWLYRVAYRIAVRARAAAVRRGGRQQPWQDQTGSGTEPELIWRDLRPVLDDEVNRLPPKYRVPFVLCYLQGKTNAEAARQLGCPEGTVFSRLAWAREHLRRRLTGRGVTLTGALFADAVAERLPPVSPTPWLIGSTVRAGVHFAAGKPAPAGAVSESAVALAKGAIHNMFISRLKGITCALAILGSAVGTGGMLMQRTLAQKPANHPAFIEAAGRETPADGARGKKRDTRPFPNEDGYTWAVAPVKFPDGVSGGAYHVSANSRALFSLAEGKKGELIVTLAHKPSGSRFRAVAFNEKRKRFGGAQPAACGGNGISLELYTFDPGELRAADVRYVGIEELASKEEQKN